MEPVVDHPKQSDSAFAVVAAGVFDNDRGVEIHVGEAFEADAAFADVPGVLRRIELKLHDYIVYTITF